MPLFLHFYYGTKVRNRTTSHLLRESVTLGQLIGLDKEESYYGLHPGEEDYRRRTFWFLYVTERGHAMQNSISTCLTNSIKLPSPSYNIQDHVFDGFHKLLRLFKSMDDGILCPAVCNRIITDQGYREKLCHVHRELRQQTHWPAKCNETQKADISITQQWLRILVWQLSLRNISMSSDPGDDIMSLTYPIHVARDALHYTSALSLPALVAQGLEW